jgi:hypothetical protein
MQFSQGGFLHFRFEKIDRRHVEQQLAGRFRNAAKALALRFQGAGLKRSTDWRAS